MRKEGRRKDRMLRQMAADLLLESLQGVANKTKNAATYSEIFALNF